jgi:hypothetical protein
MLVQKDESSPTAASNLASPSSIFGGPASPPAADSSRAGALGNNPSFFRTVANLSAMPSTSQSRPPVSPPTPTEADLLRDYDNLFRIMYNYPPVLDGINIADAYVQCKSLLTLADQYDALSVVGPRVDHHLLQFQSRLWKQIAKYPISYLRLGYLARSKVIFQEALIHVVGQWPAGERSLRAALPDTVLDIIEDKVDELEEAVARVEARLFRLTLTTRSGERVSPATGYLDWLAVSLFRQWLADNTSPPQENTQTAARRANTAGRVTGAPAARAGSNSSSSADEDNSNTTTTVALTTTSANSKRSAAIVAAAPLASLGRTYRTIGSPAAAAYLGHDECKRFLKLSPELYSRDNLRRFEKRVEELRAMARDLVRPLMGSGLELESSRGPAEAISYLTCTTVRDEDLPWSVY